MKVPEANTTELENEVANSNESIVENEQEVENDNTSELKPNAEEVNVEETTDTEPENVQANEEETTFSEKEILEKFDNIGNTIEELVQMAKEGLEHRNEVISGALESGVHSMGNSFNKDIFTKTFSNMNTKDIEEMGKTWEAQAKAQFEKEKVSKQDFSNESTEEIRRVDFKQFKTSIY